MPKDDLPELSLTFINGNGPLAIGDIKEIHFDADSKAAIDLGLEECKKLPSHIQNKDQRALYVEHQGKLRRWQEAIKKPATAQQEQIDELRQLIKDCIRAELQPFNEELARVIDQITRWDSTIKVGLSADTASLRRKGLDAQGKAEKAKSKNEQKRLEDMARKYFKEAEKAEKEDKTKRSEGAVHKERWGADDKDIDIFALARFDTGKRFYRIILEQHVINTYCKDLERNGGTVHPIKTIPGLKLSKKSYTSFYA